jgi:hypothetical protein
MNKYKLAEDPNTPPKRLSQLSCYKDWVVRFWVAHNPSTSPETLEKLSFDNNYHVRVYVTRNPNTPNYIKMYFRYELLFI